MNLRNRFVHTIVAGMLLAGTAACSDEGIIDPVDELGAAAVATPTGQAALVGEANDQACWGQATRVFAAMGVMGEHASSYETPRLGLRNLARSLYELGHIEDDSMQALGAFVAELERLSISACM